MASFIHRRSTTSSRLRENHIRNPVSNSAPLDAKPTLSSTTGDDSSMREEPNVPRRKKGSLQGASSSNQSGSTRVQRPLSNLPEATNEQRRKSTHRPVSHSSDVEVQALLEPHPSRKHSKSKRRDHSASRDVRPTIRLVTPHAADERHARGQDDYARIKDELEAIKKQLSTYKKNIGKHNKAMEDLRKELASSQKSHQEDRKLVEKLQTKSSKSDEVIAAIEANMNCQICMDILMKPYGLSPCGHVLCLTCLQEWFRAAPAGEDDMYDDDPDSLVYRKKTCPVCRTTVFSRPIPLFLVKAIAAALNKTKDADASVAPSSPAPDSDPWEGIFADPVDHMWIEEDDYHDAYSDDDLSEAEIYGDAVSDPEDWPFDGYGSEEDDVPYEGPYEAARWAPYRYDVDPEEYPLDLSDETLALLRRGATTPMIDLFEMSYSEADGIRAVMGGNIVFLGWNIERNPVDETGEEFMEWIVADVYNHPERWNRHDHFDNSWTAWRLMRADEVEDYGSDSDGYYDEEGGYNAYYAGDDSDEHPFRDFD